MRIGREGGGGRVNSLVLLVVVADKNGNAVIIALLIVARGTRGEGKCLSFFLFFLLPSSLSLSKSQHQNSTHSPL